MEKKWQLFLCSVFFVLGFSVIFSLVGVLLAGKHPLLKSQQKEAACV